MCVIAWASNACPRWRLVLAANRDEYHARPTVPLGFWPDAPHVCAGRDGRAGGTWMGVTRSGRFAAVTNVRDARRLPPAEPLSRGALAATFLLPASEDGRLAAPAAEASSNGWAGSFIANSMDEGLADHARRVAAETDRYAGFNLLLGDLSMRTRWCWVGTGSGGPHRLADGVHAISNGSLHDDWFKTRALAGAVREALDGGSDDEALFRALARRDAPADRELPDTGVGLEQERLLAPIRVEAPGYGTRSSTVLRVGSDGRVRIVERTFAPGAYEAWTDRLVEFDLS